MMTRTARALLPVALAAMTLGLGTDAAAGVRWEIVPGLVHVSRHGLNAWSLGTRAHIPISERFGVRVGLSRFEGETRYVEVGATTLEVGVDFETQVRPGIVVGGAASLVGVHGRASDAEEWDLARASSYAPRLAANARIALGESGRLHVTPELGLRYADRRTRGEASGGDPTDPDEPGPLSGSLDVEITMGVGWTFGKVTRSAR